MWFFLLLAICASIVTAATVGGDIQVVSDYKLLKTGPRGSKLYQVVADNASYEVNPFVLDLIPNNSFSAGYDAAYLMGENFLENYENLVKSMLGDEWWEKPVEILMNKVLDWQWNDYLSKQVPDEYLQELQGMTAGGLAAGLRRDVSKDVTRGIVMANLPGSLENLVYILKDEKEHPLDDTSAGILAEYENLSVEAKEQFKRIGSRWAGLTCSMFGVWGSRTADGRVYTGRNLDWLKDTGLSNYKLVTIHHPRHGHAHATFGYAGVWGALTGMSAAGLTVHEANLESNDITFRGLPWLLRLREVMSKASNINEALQVFAETNSTVGFNHGIGSAADQSAVVLETMMGNDAVFGSNDEREKTYIVNDVNTGNPREEAVYRTNHGFDPYTIEHYMWNGTHSFENSLMRYQLFPTMLDQFKVDEHKVTAEDAVYMTAVVAGKGDSDAEVWSCVTPNKGTNVLSVAFDPSERVAYAAWEDGNGNTWTPAACNTYLAMDLKKFF